MRCVRCVVALLVVGCLTPEVASAQAIKLIVSIQSPSQGATITGTTAVTAHVTMVGGLIVQGVQFKLDGANLGAQDGSAPYSVSWDSRTANNGSHILTAVAIDVLGGQWTSSPVTVTSFNDLTPPAVSITAPANGVMVGGTVTIAAAASDNVGVAGVQFKLDGVTFGAEVTSVPYTITWSTTTASNSSHTLAAVARDAAGNTTTSAATTVTVFNDTTPPSVAVTAPAGGTTLSGTTTIAAAASDNVAVVGVQFKLDGANFGAELLSAPYALAWDTKTATNAPHTLTAVARDAAGNAAASAATTITVFNDTTPPSVAVTEPAGGTTVSGTTTIAAAASDNVAVVGVQLKVDGVNVGPEETNNPYALSWDTKTATNASHTVTAVARDAAGNMTTSAPTTVTVFNDTTAPTVNVTAPADGATVSGTATIAASATDDVAVVGVQFQVDGVNTGAEATVAPFTLGWDTTTATNASHTLTAVARDAAGNTTTSTAETVTVSNGITIRIEDTTTAIEYARVWTQNYTGAPGGWSGGSIAFSVEATARATLDFTGTGVSWIGWRGPQLGIANVYLDGANVGSIDAYSTTTEVGAVLYTSPTLALGPHTLAIEVTRTRNAASTDFYVAIDAFDVFGAPPDTSPPLVAISAPAGGAALNGTTTIRATASDDVEVVGVQFFVDGSLLADDAAVPYAFNWNTTAIGDGPHTLTAVARDGAGNTTTSAEVSVTVANSTPPPVSTRYEDTDLSIAYVSGTLGPGQPPDWFHGSRSRNWSGGTATFNRSAGATATFTFTGTSVSWIGFRAPWAGIANVYVDGALAEQVDLYSTSEVVQTAVFTATNLTAGTHSIRVESTGTKNTDANDYAVVVDAFDVTPGTPPTILGVRTEETSAATTFTSGWTQGDTTTSWSGGSAAVSATPAVPGARGTFMFTGTSVSWIGLRGPKSGIARVYLDGAFQATVDLFAQSPLQTVVYTATTLANASHTLSIEVTGQKNALASDTTVTVDAFDVQSRVEEDDSAVVFSASWVSDLSRDWSRSALQTGGGAAMRSTTAGSHADVAFSGTSISWIGFRGPWIGMADVSIDGGQTTRVDLYSATEQVQIPVFTATGLAPGSHTLRIDVPGVKNPSSIASWVVVDAFDVDPASPAPAVTRFQQSDPSASYSTDWTTSGVSNLFSGETVKQSVTVGGRATFTFTGTSVRWIGERGFDTGLADVSIDGQFVARVDTRTAIQEGYQAVLFATAALAAGTHTLTIDVVGRNNEPPGAAVQRVVIDAFDVY